MISDVSGLFKTTELPPLELGQARYLFAAGGIYYEQNDEMFHASTRIHEFWKAISMTLPLLAHEEFFRPRFPTIPAFLMSQCLGFFKHVEDETDCECGLVLLYDPETYQYSWCCPEQEISKWDLKFTTPVPGKDYPEHLIHFGDIHLHPGISAYHSGTDHGDEMTASDGLHLVVGTPNDWQSGHWDKKLQSYVGRTKKPVEFCGVFVSEGARFKVQPAEVLESVQCVPGPFPKEWLKKCKKAVQKVWTTGVGFGGGYGQYD